MGTTHYVLRNIRYFTCEIWYGDLGSLLFDYKHFSMANNVLSLYILREWCFSWFNINKSMWGVIPIYECLDFNLPSLSQWFWGATFVSISWAIMIYVDQCTISSGSNVWIWDPCWKEGNDMEWHVWHITSWYSHPIFLDEIHCLE